MIRALNLLLALSFGLAAGCGSKRAPAAGGEAAQTLPTPAEVFERHIRATGGDPTSPRPRPEATHMVADLTMPAQGLSGHIESWTQGQNMLTKMSIGGVGDLQTGIYEGVGWASDNLEGPRLLEEAEVNQLEFDADPAGDQRWETRYASVVVTGVAPFGDEDCYVVAATKPTGDVRTVYFSVETGLNMGHEERVKMNLGSLNVRTELSNYREIEGELTPTVITATTMGIEQVITIVSYTSSPTEIPSLAPPPEIQALIDEAAAER